MDHIAKTGMASNTAFRNTILPTADSNRDRHCALVKIDAQPNGVSKLIENDLQATPGHGEDAGMPHHHRLATSDGNK
jgi:hypothetical protein